MFERLKKRLRHRNESQSESKTSAPLPTAPRSEAAPRSSSPPLFPKLRAFAERVRTRVREALSSVKSERKTNSFQRRNAKHPSTSESSPGCRKGIVSQSSFSVIDTRLCSDRHRISQVLSTHPTRPESPVREGCLPPTAPSVQRLPIDENVMSILINPQQQALSLNMLVREAMRQAYALDITRRYLHGLDPFDDLARFQFEYDWKNLLQDMNEFLKSQPCQQQQRQQVEGDVEKRPCNNDGDLLPDQQKVAPATPRTPTQQSYAPSGIYQALSIVHMMGLFERFSEQQVSVLQQVELQRLLQQARQAAEAKQQSTMFLSSDHSSYGLSNQSSSRIAGGAGGGEHQESSVSFAGMSESDPPSTAFHITSNTTSANNRQSLHSAEPNADDAESVRCVADSGETAAALSSINEDDPKSIRSDVDTTEAAISGGHYGVGYDNNVVLVDCVPLSNPRGSLPASALMNFLPIDWHRSQLVDTRTYVMNQRRANKLQVLESVAAGGVDKDSVALD